MRKVTAICLLLFAVWLAACSKDEERPVPNTLTGSWKYVGFSGGFAGFPFTPEDTVTYFLQFDASRYTAIRNNTQGCGTYTFDKDNANNLSHIGLLGLSGEYPDKFDAYLKNDTLTLYPHEVADGMSYHFVYSLKHFDWCDSTDTH